jgi:hypothetical protein
MKDRFKLTPMLESGLTLDFTVDDKNPITKPAHLHFRWAKEKCPVCGSAVMIIYCPTDMHQAGVGSALPEQNHKTVTSCVSCSLLLTKSKEG